MNEYTIIQIGNLGNSFPGRLFHEGAIDENNIVWESDDGNDLEIFLHNGSETVQLTDNNVNDSFPVISGNDVAWVQENVAPEPGEATGKIFLAILDNTNLNSSSQTVLPEFQLAGIACLLCFTICAISHANFRRSKLH